MADYTPVRIDFLIRNIEHLRAAAETPGTAAQLMGPYRRGSTPIAIHADHAGGYRGDPLRWADALADLELAVERLSTSGLGRRVLIGRLTGVAVGSLGPLLRRRRQDIYRANHDAIEDVARILGWSS